MLFYSFHKFCMLCHFSAWKILFLKKKKNGKKIIFKINEKSPSDGQDLYLVVIFCHELSLQKHHAAFVSNPVLGLVFLHAKFSLLGIPALSVKCPLQDFSFNCSLVKDFKSTLLHFYMPQFLLKLGLIIAAQELKPRTDIFFPEY